jgi:DNA-binding CsgD family transcriptional regulator
MVESWRELGGLPPSPSVSRRLGTWFDLIGELLQRPLDDFPRQTLQELLYDTFDVAGVSWNWQDAADHFGMVLTPVGPRSPIESWEEYEAGALHRGHPLVRWHAVTGDFSPQTSGRVPWSISSPHERAHVQELLRGIDGEEQLSLNYRSSVTGHRAFILGRTGGDFTDEDLELACRLQPLIVGLDRQVEFLRDAYGRLPLPVGECRLTGRELTVLVLLAEGRTAQAIGHNLSLSPRTVHKHLEHIYRKLGVADRLDAVRVSKALGLLPDREGHWWKVTESTRGEAKAVGG